MGIGAADTTDRTGRGRSAGGVFTIRDEEAMCESRVFIRRGATIEAWPESRLASAERFLWTTVMMIARITISAETPAMTETTMMAIVIFGSR